jgi:hypothetical protein
MSNSKVIAREIEKLKLEYTQVRRRELESIACNKEVVEKLNKGQYVICSNNGCWWCDNGILIDTCSADDMQAIENLRRKGEVRQI